MAAVLENQFVAMLTVGAGQVSIVPPGRPSGRPRQPCRSQRACSRRRHEAPSTDAGTEVGVCLVDGVCAVPPRSMSAGARRPRLRGHARGHSRGTRAPVATTEPPSATVDLAPQVEQFAAGVVEGIPQRQQSTREKEAVAEVNGDVEDDGDDDESFVAACLGECAAGIIGGLVGDAVDDYADDVVHDIMSATEATLVLPAQEPPIIEDEIEERAAEAEAALDEIRQQAPQTTTKDVADALTLSVLLEAARALANCNSSCIDETPKQDIALAPAEIPKKEAPEAALEKTEPMTLQPAAFSSMPSVGSWLMPCPPRPKPKAAPEKTEPMTQQPAAFLNMPSVGSWLMPCPPRPKPKEQESKVDEEALAVEQLREKLRNAIEEALVDGSLDDLLVECNRRAVTTADRHSKVERLPDAGQLSPCSRRPSVRRLCPPTESGAPLQRPSVANSVPQTECWPSSIQLPPCSRQSFSRQLCPRTVGAPVPEEPFPLDCLPMSAPVARDRAPVADVQTSSQGQEELMMNLRNAIRSEAASTIQTWYRGVAVRQQRAKQTAATSSPDVRLSASFAAPVPPTSPTQRSSGGLAGRRRMLGLRASSSAAPSESFSAVQADAEVPASTHPAAAAPTANQVPAATHSAVPTPPSAPKTSRPGSRPFPGCTKAAAGGQVETDQHRHQVPLSPQAPRTARANSSGGDPMPLNARGRTIRPAVGAVVEVPSPTPREAPFAWGLASDPFINLDAPPKPQMEARMQPMQSPRPATVVDVSLDKAAWQKEQTSAMALDFGLVSPRMSTLAAAGAASTINAHAWPLAAESPTRTPRAVGTGLLPMLPQQGANAATISWSRKVASTPREARHKSIDRKQLGREAQPHVMYGE